MQNFRTIMGQSKELRGKKERVRKMCPLHLPGSPSAMLKGSIGTLLGPMYMPKNDKNMTLRFC